MAWATIEDILAAVDGQTVPRRFMELVAAHPDHEALNARLGDAPGQWQTWSLADYRELVAQAAAGLAEAGVRAGDRVLMMMRNRPDFHWFDTAAQFLRATPVSIYNSSSQSSPVPRLPCRGSDGDRRGHRGPRAAAEDPRRAAGPTTQHVIEPGPIGGLPAGVHLASELLDAGTADLEALAAATDASDIATLIYTAARPAPPRG